MVSLAILAGLVASGFYIADAVTSDAKPKPSILAHIPNAWTNLPPEEQRNKLLALAASPVWTDAFRCLVWAHVPQLDVELFISNQGDRPATIHHMAIEVNSSPVTSYEETDLAFGRKAAVFIQPGQQVRFLGKFDGPGTITNMQRLEDFSLPMESLNIASDLDPRVPKIWTGHPLSEVRMLLTLKDSEGNVYRTAILLGAEKLTYYMASFPEVSRGKFDTGPFNVGGGGQGAWLIAPYDTINPFWNKLDCLQPS